MPSQLTIDQHRITSLNISAVFIFLWHYITNRKIFFNILMNWMKCQCLPLRRIILPVFFVNSMFQIWIWLVSFKWMHHHFSLNIRGKTNFNSIPFVLLWRLFLQWQTLRGIKQKRLTILYRYVRGHSRGRHQWRHIA